MKVGAFQHIFRTWYPAAILAITLYLVYGSVATTGSLLIPRNPLASLLVFSIALFVIFFLEALEVSVIALYSREETTLTPKSMADFLKGRQLVLILIVFVSAQASASSASTLPFTNLTVPPLLALTLFQWGFLGSLLVLWIGQLGGKIMASYSPKGVLDMPPSRALLRLSTFLGGTPIVATADWFVHRATSIMRLRSENWQTNPFEGSDEYMACAINNCPYGSVHFHYADEETR